MSIEKVSRESGTVWRVRWREGSRARSRVIGRKADAIAFDAEVRRRQRLGEIGFEATAETLDQYVTETWAHAHGAHLAPKTRKTYAWAYDVHIEPRLGTMQLRQINPEVVARFQADLLSAGLGGEGVRKTVTLLGGILQRAAESRRIPYNPARVVRKAPLPQRDEVRPLAPEVVERMRAAVGHRDATLLSVLALAGLRPQEARGLRWDHVGDRTLTVTAPKTRTRRSVRLLAPLAADLAEWRLACGRPDGSAYVFPGNDGEEWSENGFNKWRGRTFRDALDAAGVEHARPNHLRHSFASLLLHEGRSVIYVARQLGHGADLTMRTYGHVIEELEDAPRLPADEAIRRARAKSVSVLCRTGEGSKR
jgi:integrase